MIQTLVDIIKKYEVRVVSCHGTFFLRNKMCGLMNFEPTPHTKTINRDFPALIGKYYYLNYDHETRCAQIYYDPKDEETYVNCLYNNMKRMDRLKCFL